MTHAENKLAIARTLLAAIEHLTRPGLDGSLELRLSVIGGLALDGLETTGPDAPDPRASTTESAKLG